MLPSKGYFKSLDCPYYETLFCDRPHCHFRHTKKDNPLDYCEEDLNEQPLDTNNDVSKRPLNVDTVWNQAYHVLPPNVSYKPTPIAVLQRRVSETTHSSAEPTQPNKRHLEYDIKESRKPKAEYVPSSIPSVQNPSIGYKHSASSDPSNNLINNSENCYKATKISETQKNWNAMNSSGPKQLQQEDEDEESEGEIDMENIYNGLDRIEQILHEQIEYDDINNASIQLDELESIERPTDSLKKLLSNEVKSKENILVEKNEHKAPKKEIQVADCNKTKEPIKTVNLFDNNTQKTVNINKTHTESSNFKDQSCKTSSHRKGDSKSSKSTVHHKSSEKEKPKKDLHDDKHGSKRKLDSDYNSSDSSKRPRKDEHSRDKKSSKIETEYKSSSSKSTGKSSDSSVSVEKSSKKSSRDKHSSSKSSSRDSKESTHRSSHKSKKHEKSSSSSSSRTKTDDGKSTSVSKTEFSKSNGHKSGENKRKHREKRSSSSKENHAKRKKPNDNGYDSDVQIISVIEAEPVVVLDSGDESIDNFTSDNYASDSSVKSIVETRKPIDLNAVVDHRVQSRQKSRVSRGTTWRPPATKRVAIMTPAERQKIFLSQRNEQIAENLTDNNIERVRIQSVPNVKNMLKEKERLLQNKSHTAVVSAPPPRQAIPLTVEDPETKDEPPKIANTVNSSKRDGADSILRQTQLEVLYSVTRQLVSPEHTYGDARRESLRIEEAVWLSSTHKTYKSDMVTMINSVRDKIPGFTQIYYRQLRPKRESLFPVEINPKKMNNSGIASREESLYSALLPFLLSEEKLVSEGYPRWKDKCSSIAYINTASQDKWKRHIGRPPRGERACVNCSKFYQVDENGLSIDPNGCSYHAKKSCYYRRVKGLRIGYHRCCDRISDWPCIYSNHHSNETLDFNNLEGFRETSEPLGQEPEEGWGVYALDCEMYFSVRGIELGRVTIVNPENRIILDVYVTPERTVTDYCTKMSGLTERNLYKDSISFAAAQARVLELFNSRSILIGHSLENDLKVLKIIHNRVVDTAMVFINLNGTKPSLKSLALQKLNERIQGEDDGHDSAQDATTCIKLMLHKLKSIHRNKPSAPTPKSRYGTTRDPGIL